MAPGLEKVSLREMKDCGVDNGEIHPGRITFTCKLDILYRLHIESRTIDRISLILSTFRCGAIEDLFKKASTIQWELFVFSETPLQFHVEINQSPLSREMVQESLRTAIRRYFKNLPDEYWHSFVSKPESIPQRVDAICLGKQCIISIDATGELLYRRGYKKDAGIAPIRETLAAGILLSSGWKPHVPLVDGMTGSGTFAIEAGLIRSKSYTAHLRHFAFINWPSFRESRWTYLLKQAKDGIRVFKVPLIANDSDEIQLERARKNAYRAYQKGFITFTDNDFFTMTAKSLNIEKGCLILNAPYGKRLSKSKLRSFYYNLGAHLKKNFKSWRVILLYPATDLENALGIKGANYRTFTTGGLKIRVLVAKL